MNPFLQQIYQGKRPRFEVFVNALSPFFDLLPKLFDTPQDTEWHSEGNVGVHTSLVLQEIYQLLENEANHLQEWQKFALIIASVLHDIGKPLVTRESEQGDKVRILARHHEEQGCSYLAYKIMELGLTNKVVHTILSLVGLHHMPKLLTIKQSTAEAYFKLARQIDVELLYFLAKADMQGRFCKDKAEQVAYIEFFKLYCQDYGLWRKNDPYEEWAFFLENRFLKDDRIRKDYILSHAIMDFETSAIKSYHEAQCRPYCYRTSFPELVIMCGPSGSGKSHWLKKHLPSYKIISLDDFREQFCHDSSDQSKNRELIAKAKDILKEHLRNGEKIVWDATNLRKDFREMLFNLGALYHALVTLVVFHMSPEEVFQGNNKRNTKIPQDILHQQFLSFEWPSITETHRILFIDKNCKILHQSGFLTSTTTTLKEILTDHF